LVNDNGLSYVDVGICYSFDIGKQKLNHDIGIENVMASELFPM
jgi:hypothetical protein